MKLERAHLQKRNEGGHRFGHHVKRVAAVAIVDRDARDRFVNSAVGILLIERLLVPAVGTTNERQRTAADVRQHPFADRRVIQREIALGELRFGIEHLVGIAERYAGDRIAVVRLARSGTRQRLRRRFVRRVAIARERLALTNDFRCALVGPQTLERRMAQRAVRRHLADETSATSTGSTQCARRASAPWGGLWNDGVCCTIATSERLNVASDCALKPVPTL